MYEIYLLNKVIFVFTIFVSDISRARVCLVNEFSLPVMTGSSHSIGK